MDVQYKYILKESEAHGAPLKLSGLLVSRLDDLLGQAGEPSSVETVTLWTGTSDELVEECNCLLTRILTFILHHARLNGSNREVKHYSKSLNTKF